MLVLDDIELRYGKKVLFDGVGANINVRDRIGLVGSNGAGKSTLLKAVVGQVELDGGKVEKAKYVTLGYLPQDGLDVQGRTLYKEVESAFGDIIELQNRIEDASNELYEVDPCSDEYMELLEIITDMEHRLEEMDAAKLQSKIEKVLQGLGFSMADMERDCGEFSGGWQMRIALAKLLLCEPSVLLLDEPTNHLDISSQRWLENYLKRYEGAMLIISHDRGFLDMLCNRTFEVTLGKLNVYEGNYSFFVKQREERKFAIEQAYKNQKKQLEKTERFVERFRSKASKAKQVQSRIKALDKIERVTIDREESTIAFTFPEAPPSGQVVLKVKNLVKNYGEKRVIKGVDLKIEKGEKIAIVGVNGAGKSTLAKVIAGAEPSTSGEMEMGYNVRPAYFAQQLAEELDPELSALEVVESEAEIKANHRSVLGSFLFRGDDVFKKTKVLSGGERCRLALACMLVKKANFMILDEPTNHLDMNSQDTLQAALKAYKGTMLIVSHNRSFLDPIVDKVIEISHDGIRTFLGNVSYYLEKVEAEDMAELAKLEPVKVQQKKPDGMSSKEKRRLEAQKREELKPLKKRLTKIEKEIEVLEITKKECEEKMADPSFFETSTDSSKCMKVHHDTEQALSVLLKEWEDITAKLE